MTTDTYRIFAHSCHSMYLAMLQEGFRSFEVDAILAKIIMVAIKENMRATHKSPDGSHWVYPDEKGNA